MTEALLTVCDRLRQHALAQPLALAMVDEAMSMDWRTLDQWVDRIAATLQRDAGGSAHGDALVLAGRSSVMQAAFFMGALRAGVVVAPMPTSVTEAQFRSMVADATPRWIVHDATALPLMDALDAGALAAMQPPCHAVALDSPDGLSTWLMPMGALPAPETMRPGDAFNIIYSSGTTGTPKGIVQSHGMRAMHVERGAKYAYGPGKVTLLATPLYSNTTLVVLMPSIAWGSTTVVMGKFDAATYLQLAAKHRVTHTMLVPVQYQRIMARPDFDAHDLGAFEAKFCTSAPFSAALKADVLQRWPGGLTEFYGMTEGGALASWTPTCIRTNCTPSARPARGTTFD